MWSLDPRAVVQGAHTLKNNSFLIVFTRFLKMTTNRNLFLHCYLHVFWKWPHNKLVFTLFFTCFLKMTSTENLFLHCYLHVFWKWPQKHLIVSLFFYTDFNAFPKTSKKKRLWQERGAHKTEFLDMFKDVRVSFGHCLTNKNSVFWLF